MFSWNSICSLCGCGGMDALSSSRNKESAFRNGWKFIQQIGYHRRHTTKIAIILYFFSFSKPQNVSNFVILFSYLDSFSMLGICVSLPASPHRCFIMASFVKRIFAWKMFNKKNRENKRIIKFNKNSTSIVGIERQVEAKAVRSSLFSKSLKNTHISRFTRHPL